MRRCPALAIITFGLVLAMISPARAQGLPFTATLSNTTPLAFGMTPDQAGFALGTPLTYVSGRPGNEIFVTLRHYGGSGFFPRNDPLYLQFRRGYLTGWKGFWGNRWIVGMAPKSGYRFSQANEGVRRDQAMPK